MPNLITHSWLHHNNCDRLWAIYQALYPDLWISASGLANEIGTFTIPRGAIEYANTSLTPFYTSNSTPAVFWTSDTARTTKVFGYSYPELDDWSQTPDQLKQNVTAQVNALYGPTAVAATTTPRAHIPGTAHRHPHTRQVVQAPITEWFITCSVDKLSLKGSSFTVLFFLDAAPADSSIWSSATNLLGSMSVLVPPGMASTGHTSPTLQYTELPITDILVELGLDSADEAAVGPALAERLQWKVQLVREHLLRPDAALTAFFYRPPPCNYLFFNIYYKPFSHDSNLAKSSSTKPLLPLPPSRASISKLPAKS